MLRFTTRWGATWNGHEIVVENWWDAFLRTGERLIIDGRTAVEVTGRLRVSSELAGEIVEAGVTHRVRARVGNIDRGLRVGCHIFVDERLVGGTTEKEITAVRKPGKTAWFSKIRDRDDAIKLARDCGAGFFCGILCHRGYSGRDWNMACSHVAHRGCHLCCMRFLYPKIIQSKRGNGSPSAVTGNSRDDVYEPIRGVARR